MFKKVLIALDMTSRDHDLLEKGLEIARQNQADLLLLHVLSGEDEGSPMPIPPGIDDMYWVPGSDFDLERWRQEWQAYQSRCLEQLREYAVKANSEGINAEFRQVSGGPGSMICKAAQVWNADVIVIGNRGRRGLTELVLGSVSSYVLHHVPCSVLVIKSTESQSAEWEADSQIPDEIAV